MLGSGPESVSTAHRASDNSAVRRDGADQEVDWIASCRCSIDVLAPLGRKRRSGRLERADVDVLIARLDLAPRQATAAATTLRTTPRCPPYPDATTRPRQPRRTATPNPRSGRRAR